ncbi:MAG: hypothetical protein AAGI34_14030 [Pseudomonadota bacterium]
MIGLEAAFPVVSTLVLLVGLATPNSPLGGWIEQPRCGDETACWAGEHSQSRSTQPAVVLAQANDSIARARKGDFDETGTVSCAQESGERLKTCRAAVSRGAGVATVVVTFPNGFARALYFEGAAFVRASTTMSGSGRDIEWRVVGGLYAIRVDDQRFEIEADFVLGD